MSDFRGYEMAMREMQDRLAAKDAEIERLAREHYEARAEIDLLRARVEDYHRSLVAQSALLHTTSNERDEALAQSEARQQALIAEQIRHGHAYVAACRERDDARIFLEEALERWGQSDRHAVRLLHRIRTFLGGRHE